MNIRDKLLVFHSSFSKDTNLIQFLTHHELEIEVLFTPWGNSRKEHFFRTKEITEVPSISGELLTTDDGDKVHLIYPSEYDCSETYAYEYDLEDIPNFYYTSHNDDTSEYHYFEDPLLHTLEKPWGLYLARQTAEFESLVSNARLLQFTHNPPENVFFF